MKTYTSVLSVIAALAVCSTSHATYLGNPLVSGATDGDAPLVILGEYNAAGPGLTSTLSFQAAAVVHNVQVWDNSAGQTFTAYLLQPAGTNVDGFAQFKVLDGQSFVTTAPGGGGVDTFPLSGQGWQAQAGASRRRNRILGNWPCLFDWQS